MIVGEYSCLPPCTRISPTIITGANQETEPNSYQTNFNQHRPQSVSRHYRP